MKILDRQQIFAAGGFVKAIACGGWALLENLSLIILAGFAVWAALKLNMDLWQQRVLLAAAAVIAVRGAWELCKDFAAIYAARSSNGIVTTRKFSIHRPR